jgi:hypothetical protein
MRILVVLLALFVAAPVFAQPAGAPVDRREKIKKKIRALRAYTLTEELALDEATAGKLFPLLARYDDEFDKLLGARVDLQKRLSTADQLKDPKQIDKLIDEAAANQRALWDTESKRLAELRKILTPAQVARTVVILPALERKIQNQLRRAARKGARMDDDADGVDDVRPQKKRPCDPVSSRTPCK